MIRVIGFGNPLHGDDGFGPAVIGRLAAHLHLPDVEIGEAPPPGPAAFSLFEDCESVIIVDALRDDGPAGEVGWVDARVVAATASPGAALHGGGLAEMLRLLPLAIAGCAPRIEILLGRVARIRPFQPGLSPQVARAVGRAAALVETRIHMLRECPEQIPALKGRGHG